MVEEFMQPIFFYRVAAKNAREDLGNFRASWGTTKDETYPSTIVRIANEENASSPTQASLMINFVF